MRRTHSVEPNTAFLFSRPFFFPALSLIEAAPGGVANTATAGGGGTAGGARGAVGARELAFYCGPHDLKRLGLYSRNLVDYHLITELLPMLSRLYFLGR